MVNPRWRPTIANSRNGNKNYNEGEVKSEFNLPAPGKYIGTHIKSDLGGKKVSNKSYEKYYKGMI